MKTVTIDGEVYTKASILAEQFGYTSDYIGQLCRADKVDAELVGRSWYVNEHSLSKHKDSRYEQLRGNEIVSKIKVGYGDEPSGPRVPVRPTLSKLTSRSIPNATDFHWEQHIVATPLATYEHDDYELVPESKENLVDVSPEKIPAKASDTTTIPINIISKNPYKVGFSDTRRESSSVGTHQSKTGAHGQVEDVHSSRISDVGIVDTKQRKLKTPAKNKKKASKSPRFTPEMVKSAELSSASSSIVPLSFIMALVIALLIITLDTQIITGGMTVNSRLVFNTASLEQIFTLLGSLR